MTQDKKIETIPLHKRSIRDLRVGKPTRAHTDEPDREYVRIEKKEKRAYVVTIILIGISLFAITSLLAALFPKASISITPQTTSIHVQESPFLAGSVGSDNVDIQYELISQTLSESATLTATHTEQASEAASGMITIKNVFSTTPQRLIKNTRFQSESGKIYRIKESINVPGMKKVDGVNIPGTLDARVYADDVGDTYNIQSGKLTLPGLKDKADMYAGITAEVISPISGGFVGERPVITNEEKTAAYEKLKETLASKSEGALSDKVPDKYIYIPRSMHLEYSEGREEYNNNTVTLTLDVTATAPIFVYTDFITLLTKLSKETTLSNSSKLNSVDSLSLAEIVTTKDDTTRKYTLSGTTTIIWGIDSADIRNNLAGVSRSAVTAIMSKYPGIARAEVSIRPLWISHLPTNPETIEIIIIDPAAEK